MIFFKLIYNLQLNPHSYTIVHPPQRGNSVHKLRSTHTGGRHREYSGENGKCPEHEDEETGRSQLWE